MRFASAAAVAALLEIGLCLLAGALFGRAIIDLVARIVLPVSILASAVPMAMVIGWLVYARHAEDPVRVSAVSGARAGTYAGGLATVGAGLSLNLLTYLIAVVTPWTGWAAGAYVELAP